MIDTLKLSLSDYKIAPGAHLQIQPGVVDNATGDKKADFPLWHDGKKYVQGAKAFHNGEDFNVTVKPFRPGDANSIGCLVQFSLPKIADGSNYHGTDYKGTQTALATVERYLREVGIKTNLKTAFLSRVDAFKTVEAEEPYMVYHPVLSVLHGQRMAKRDYGTTFLWANGQQEICVYDKLAEMECRKLKVDGLPENSIRFEFRMLKASKVQSTLDMKTVGDLLAGYDHVAQVYKKNIKKQLFRRDVGELAALTVGQVEDELRYFKEDLNKRYWYRSWIIANGHRAVAVDAEAVKRAVGAVAGNRMMANRINKQIEEARLDAIALDVLRPSKRPLGELYAELKEKVLA